MHQLATKKTLPLAIAGATLLSLATVGTDPATAALFRLTADFNDGNQFSITYDGDKLGTVNDNNDNLVSYDDAIVDFSFVSPTFSFSFADFGTPTNSYTLIGDGPRDGRSFIQNFIEGPSSTYFISGLPIVGDAFTPVTPTSLQTESRGSFLPQEGGPLSCCTPNFLLVFAGGLTGGNVSEFVESGQAILLNSGGTYEIARVPIASTPEPVVPWWFAGALVGGWWLRGLRVGRKQ
jgi:hypothetical protein